VTADAEVTENLNTSFAAIDVVQPVNVESVDFCAADNVGGEEPTIEAKPPGNPAYDDFEIAITTEPT
jgi:hypothetical protein